MDDFDTNSPSGEALDYCESDYGDEGGDGDEECYENDSIGASAGR